MYYHIFQIQEYTRQYGHLIDGTKDYTIRNQYNLTLDELKQEMKAYTQDQISLNLKIFKSESKIEKFIPQLEIKLLNE